MAIIGINECGFPNTYYDYLWAQMNKVAFRVAGDPKLALAVWHSLDWDGQLRLSQLEKP
jgi:hypothetical protein